MKPWRTGARMALLMLTALATLVAGMPQLRCGCSPAALMAAAVAIPAHLQSCCCHHGSQANAASDQACPHHGAPGAQAAQDAPARSCCHGHDEPAPVPQDTAHLTSAVCHKVLTAAESSAAVQASSAERSTSLTVDLLAGAFAPALAPLSPTLPPVPIDRGCPPCPPLDLVTVLQRLTV